MIDNVVSALLDTLSGTEAIDRQIATAFSRTGSLDEESRQVWAALLVCLSSMQRNGHSCVVLSSIANKRFFDDIKGSKENIESEESQGSDVSEELQHSSQPRKEGVVFPSLTSLIKVVKDALSDEKISPLFVYQHGRLYSRRYFEFEQEIARQVSQRTTYEPLDEDSVGRVKSLWSDIFPTDVTDEQDWQQVAVAKCLVQRFSVINGGPGTGKTYTVLRLLLALQACNDKLNIVLAAPTGKAQQRMTESISSSIEGLRGKVNDDALRKVPTDALTLHRLLGLREHTVATRYHQHHMLNVDVLIVDEASMVDLALMARILRALPSHARLYFIGDADQLPAVELGNVLEQLVESPLLDDSSTSIAPSSTSKQVSAQRENLALNTGGVPNHMRQYIAKLCPHLPLLPVDESAKSWVATLQAPKRFKGQLAQVAWAMQKGNVLDVEAALSVYEKHSNIEGTDLLKKGVYLLPENLVNVNDLRRLAKESFEAVLNATDATSALRALNNVRWLTPVRKGPNGVEGLNALVFDAIKPKIKRWEGRFYQGQPIMIVKNHHPQRLSNGEVGVIWPDETGKLLAWFELSSGELRSISLSRLPQFETVFAMTIHKSQGSEFDNVVMLLPQPESEKAASLCHRGLVYTGLTRAKSGCLIIADKPVLKQMVATVDKRFSGLSEAITNFSTEVH
ncbi:RecBCD enzyme subunit RecD [Alteromonas sp. KUL42]|uniref:exodeoxyribonuclease V subunit alpha n=1 Tax=Alteromonas sp. KUL42 TaxID=2480797 RepID=UPI001035FC13|nr:exodeoxyribonuclease V subunit alpha [Alteromonas sp. KUL42]TAP37071.1 exodeoxyribonuclease V subunit alpha [Alteromonas sp. KUL42]GEA06478.1 RecBCD enzyme subunit RecD [Alteromonas sp. KUL42]